MQGELSYMSSKTLLFDYPVYQFPVTQEELSEVIKKVLRYLRGHARSVSYLK